MKTVAIVAMLLALMAAPVVWVTGEESQPTFRSPVVVELFQSRPVGGPSVSIAGSTLNIGSGSAPPGGANIWLVYFDPGTIPVAIRASENGGRTVPHRDIFRELKLLGRWSGERQTITLPSAPTGLRSAVLVQVQSGGPILAAAET
jgi:hypothetical protein